MLVGDHRIVEGCGCALRCVACRDSRVMVAASFPVVRWPTAGGDPLEPCEVSVLHSAPGVVCCGVRCDRGTDGLSGQVVQAEVHRLMILRAPLTCFLSPLGSMVGQRVSA